jgi:hypothetical protein
MSGSISMKHKAFFFANRRGSDDRDLLVTRRDDGQETNP